VEYAVCSTTYNCAPRLRASLESLRRAVAAFPGTEFVVVDNLSTDGTREILDEESRRDPRLRVIALRCKRGRGRQAAAQASTARFVVRADLDTVYSPRLAELLRRHAGWAERATTALATRYLDILPRALLEEFGGWRDLNYWEDVDLWHRLEHAGRLVWVEEPLGDNWDVPDPERRQEPRLLPYLRRHFVNTRDQFRADAGLTLRGKLRREWGLTRRRARFALVAGPMISLAWLSSVASPKFRPRTPPARPPPRLRLEQFG